MQSGEEVRCLASGAHAEKTAVSLTVPRPSIHAARIEMTVAGMKSAAHHPGGEVGNGKLHDSALELIADLLVRHDEDTARAVGNVEQ